jgi:hypothetical protein
LKLELSGERIELVVSGFLEDSENKNEHYPINRKVISGNDIVNVNFNLKELH